MQKRCEEKKREGESSSSACPEERSLLRQRLVRLTAFQSEHPSLSQLTATVESTSSLKDRGKGNPSFRRLHRTTTLPLPSQRAQRKRGARELALGSRSRHCQTPATSPRNVLFQLRKPCSGLLKRPAEPELELTVQSRLKRRKVTQLGPLAGKSQLWRACGALDWVIKTVSRGYRLQFAAAPPRFRGIVQSHARGEHAHILQEEIISLQNKNAIRLLSQEESGEGFYSRYFLVPKKDRGLRPI
ncbi:uncharacterized protein LOC119798851 [Cyprinodon tularosa]|uniref:uncharacterized protein LOC119798851 n=1 Tax=Cyprinodon tularosa TaxID=77115 RepID=UPI0018E1E254|nr:uncharacterized protein LOC119798851 [Cyprinodon tularosa]